MSDRSAFSPAGGSPLSSDQLPPTSRFPPGGLWPGQREDRWMLFGLSREAFSARGLWLLMAVYFGAMLVAAILAPWVFWGARAWVESSPGWWNGWLEGRLDLSDFPRYFDRLRWLPVLICLPFLMRACGLWSFRKLGFRGAPGNGFLGGLMLGLLTLIPLALLQALAEGVLWQVPAISTLLGMAAGALAGACLLALLEETIFRGFILRLFYTALRPWWAIVLSALFFAWTHFKRVPWSETQEITIWCGFEVADLTLASAILTLEAIPFLNLFLAGIVLNLAFLRTGSLWLAIGLHAGWVAFRSVWWEVAKIPAEGALWRGTTALTDGLLTAPLLILLAVGLIYWPCRRSSPQVEPPPVIITNPPLSRDPQKSKAPEPPPPS